VVEFDEEARAFLIREQGLNGEKTKAISPRRFKVGFLGSLPSDKMAAFLAAWEDQVEPLLSGKPEKGPEKEQPKEMSKGTKGKRSSLRRGPEFSPDEGAGIERPRKTSSEPSLHSAHSKLGRKKEFLAEREAENTEGEQRPRGQQKSRVSEHGDTSEVKEPFRPQKRSSSAFCFPEGVKTMEDFIAYLQPKLGQLSSNPVLVADVERCYAQVDQAKKGLHQTTGLLIRVYKAPQEWQRILLLALVYEMFIVAINGLIGYQQEALFTDADLPEGRTTWSSQSNKAGGNGSTSP
jgi:hypothetical protein